MAGPAPNTKNWTARENKHAPKGLHLIVTGMVEVNASNKDPLLTEAPHVGKVLPLDLTIKESGKGAQVVVWKLASFHKVVSANQFDSVDIRWDGKTIASCPVIDDTEHRQGLNERTKALNADYEGKSGPEPSKGLVAKRAAHEKAAAQRAAAIKAEKAAAAKYPVVKAAAPKKAAKKTTTKKAAKKKPKAVGGWAKAKKKKSAKKPAKKTAKKSALKKLVRKLVKKLTPAKKKRRK
jgi:hypothetical protein